MRVLRVLLLVSPILLPACGTRPVERQQTLRTGSAERRANALRAMVELPPDERPVPGGDRAAGRQARRHLQDESALVRMAAVQAVVRFRPSGVVADLLPLLRDENEFVRMEATRALGEIEAVEAVEALERALAEDGSRHVRRTAARALGEIGEERATGALLDRLADPLEEVGIRWAASRALAAITGEDHGDDARAWEEALAN